MTSLGIVLAVLLALSALAVLLAVKVVKQYEQGVVLRLGRVQEPREPGLRLIIPFVDVMHQVSRRPRAINRA